MKKLLACFVLAALAIAPSVALGRSDGARPLLRSTLVGSQPEMTIRGVPSGGVPWVVNDNSFARLGKNGVLRVQVRGLLITGTGGPADGTTGPVRMVFASLTCEVPGGTPTVINTASVPLNADGNARIREDLALPDTCFAPAVLVRGDLGNPGADSTDPWFAVTGF